MAISMCVINTNNSSKAIFYHLCASMAPAPVRKYKKTTHVHKGPHIWPLKFATQDAKFYQFHQIKLILH